MSTNNIDNIDINTNICAPSRYNSKNKECFTLDELLELAADYFNQETIDEISDDIREEMGCSKCHFYKCKCNMHWKLSEDGYIYDTKDDIFIVEEQLFEILEEDNLEIDKEHSCHECGQLSLYLEYRTCSDCAKDYY